MSYKQNSVNSIVNSNKVSGISVVSEFHAVSIAPTPGENFSSTLGQNSHLARGWGGGE